MKTKKNNQKTLEVVREKQFWCATVYFFFTASEGSLWREEDFCTTPRLPTMHLTTALNGLSKKPLSSRKKKASLWIHRQNFIAKKTALQSSFLHLPVPQFGASLSFCTFITPKRTLKLRPSGREGCSFLARSDAQDFRRELSAMIELILIKSFPSLGGLFSCGSDNNNNDNDQRSLSWLSLVQVLRRSDALKWTLALIGSRVHRHAKKRLRRNGSKL